VKCLTADSKGFGVKGTALQNMYIFRNLTKQKLELEGQKKKKKVTSSRQKKIKFLCRKKQFSLQKSNEFFHFFPGEVGTRSLLDC